jgi:Tol biopolymer transport system component
MRRKMMSLRDLKNTSLTTSLTTVWTASLLAGLGSSAQAGPAFTEWSTPVATVGGGCPIETRDGNELFTASGSAGTLDIWAYNRTGRNAGFGNRRLIGPPVSLDNADDFCPTPLPGNWLMFVSDRGGDGVCGNTDIYIARYDTNPAQGPGTATNLGCAPGGPNTDGREMSPSLVTTGDGTFLYYSTNVGGDHDLYRSEMAPDGSFGPGSPVSALNTGFNDQQPNVSRDGLTIVFASDRDSGVFDVFMATRDSTDAAWSAPRNLSVELTFPTAGASETRPSLSWDLTRLYYGSAGIVYVSERQPAPKSD